MDIRDIAALSGYSVGTVSRVLNEHPNVSDRARERILAVIRDCGYEPNSNARYLKMQTKTSIAAFVKGAHNLLFADILERMQTLLLEVGEEIHVVYMDEDENEVQRAAAYCRIRRRKGLIFLGGNPSYFAEGFGEITVPSILVSNSGRGLGFPNLSSLTTDDADAAATIIDELVDQGHTRIAIIGGNRGVSQVGTLRLEGALAELRRRGIDFDVELDYEPCRFSMAEGYDATVHLLMRSRGVTAIFALGDVIALGVIRALADAGLSVPGDMSVAGFDGVDSGQFNVPRLTTIRQDADLFARRGVELLLERVEHPELEAVHEVVPFKLYRRESVDRPPVHA